MPSLNIRDVTPETMKEIRVAAAHSGESIRDWVLLAIEGKLGKSITFGGEINGPGLAPDSAKGLGIQRTHAVSPRKAEVDAPEKPAPTASDIDFEPEPPKPPSVKKTKPEMPAGLSNTQMQRWIREHR